MANEMWHRIRTGRLSFYHVGLRRGYGARNGPGVWATIANGGTKREAVCIESIKDSDGITIFQADTKGEKVLDTALTQAATDVMKGVVTNGTGRGANISNGSR